MRDWRGLFDELRVDWIDHGPNTSKGNVSISCPFCGKDDPSYHMAVSEHNDAYYCYRKPRQHSGYSPLYLLKQLGRDRLSAVALLNKYNRKPTERAEPPPRQFDAQTRWSRFLPAFDNERILDYMYYKRGFDAPSAVARRFDIRYQQAGQWAQRMLLPFAFDGVVVSWTGRAIRADHEPKYYNQNVGDHGLIYVPTPARETVLIVEGPMDALKVAASSDQVGVLALAGKAANPARMLRIARFLDTRAGALQAAIVRRVHIVLDRDASLGDARAIQRELAAAAPTVYISRLALPAGYKDTGEMPEADLQDWIADVTQKGT